MSGKKTDLEIIYNLQWKNKPGHGGEKSNNIIGMYDVPSTTMNWKIFKSYLLKNSGMVGEDVKVSYVTENNREFYIESQTDFQIALYAFRRKARVGDVVNLRLEILNHSQGETVHVCPKGGNFPLCDREKTKNDNMETHRNKSCPCTNSSAFVPPTTTAAPPDWFIMYMSQFKKDIMDDVTATVSSIVSNIKCPNTQHACHARKMKGDTGKRARARFQLPELITADPKEYMKSLKLEGKLERKLEKLETKTKKIREKKQALFVNDIDTTGPKGAAIPINDTFPINERADEMLDMNATPVKFHTTVPHMLGGEIYMHQWEVKNTGKLPWTDLTTLNFTWGTKALKPVESVIKVPKLASGQVGTISVSLQIPSAPGHYECYWHFHHQERRFGSWLGCQVIVDDFNLKGNKSVLDTSSSPYSIMAEMKRIRDEDGTPPRPNVVWSDVFRVTHCPTSPSMVYNQLETEVGLTNKLDQMKIQGQDANNFSSDSDNQSNLSFGGCKCSKKLSQEEFVVVDHCCKFDKSEEALEELRLQKKLEIEENEKTMKLIMDMLDDNNNTEDVNENEDVVDENKEEDDKNEEDASSCASQKSSEMVYVTFPDDKQQCNEEDIAYVRVDGQDVPIPTKMIKEEFLEVLGRFKKSLTEGSASNGKKETPVKENETLQEEIKPQNGEQVQQDIPVEQPVDMSHCSAAGSCFSDQACADNNSRLFMFPQNNPGFEVFYPVTAKMNSEEPTDIPGTFKEQQQQQYDCTLDYQQLNQQLNQFMQQNPFAFPQPEQHVPNFQQTPVEQRASPFYVEPVVLGQDAAALPVTQAYVQQTQTNATTTTTAPTASTTSSRPTRCEEKATVHMLPETLVSGAVNVASSAFNTARSVINMIRPQENQGQWVNGHWVSASQYTNREVNLQTLAEMGFYDRDLNATLLARYKDDIQRVITELIH